MERAEKAERDVKARASFGKLSKLTDAEHEINLPVQQPAQLQLSSGADIELKGQTSPEICQRSNMSSVVLRLLQGAE